MAVLIVILLFVIAMAVAPQGILNICRLIDAVIGWIWNIACLVLPLWFFAYLIWGK